MTIPYEDMIEELEHEAVSNSVHVNTVKVYAEDEDGELYRIDNIRYDDELDAIVLDIAEITQ